MLFRCSPYLVVWVVWSQAKGCQRRKRRGKGKGEQLPPTTCCMHTRTLRSSFLAVVRSLMMCEGTAVKDDLGDECWLSSAGRCATGGERVRAASLLLALGDSDEEDDEDEEEEGEEREAVVAAAADWRPLARGSGECNTSESFVTQAAVLRRRGVVGVPDTGEGMYLDTETGSQRGG